jgi:hypothetical protein
MTDVTQGLRNPLQLPLRAGGESDFPVHPFPKGK